MTHRVCVLGASGLLGRYVVSRAVDSGLEVVGAGRSSERIRSATSRELLGIAETDIRRDGDLEAIMDWSPDAIINCAGLIKALCSDTPLAYEVNGRAPHRLANKCSLAGVRLVHVSTDCVFRGDRGRPYLESDLPDAQDVYGATKANGEVVSGPHLTVRTSFIGHESRTSFGLLEWLLAQQGQVKGFSRHLWTGLGAVTLADLLLQLAIDHREVTGLMHVAGQTIDKKSLLELLRHVYALDVSIIDDDSTTMDRRLDASRLASLNVVIPPMEEMVETMRDYEL
jgi:dTDP-4-dehydrorhamnose reductase